MCIALFFVCLPIGCAAPFQEAKEIECVDRDGDLIYTGPYDEETWNGYVVQLDDRTGAFYSKGMCHKLPA